MTGSLPAFTLTVLPDDADPSLLGDDMSVPFGEPSFPYLPDIYYRNENGIFPLIVKQKDLQAPASPALIITEPCTPYEGYLYKTLVFQSFDALVFHQKILMLARLKDLDAARFDTERDMLLAMLCLPRTYIDNAFIDFTAGLDDATIVYLAENGIAERGIAALKRFNINEIYMLTKELLRFRMNQNHFIDLIELLRRIKLMLTTELSDIFFRWDIQHIVESQLQDREKYERIYGLLYAFVYPRYTSMRAQFNALASRAMAQSVTVSTDTYFETKEIHIAVAGTSHRELHTRLHAAAELPLREFFEVVAGNEKKHASAARVRKRPGPGRKKHAT
ncbi:MAG: hypothetical protein HZC28_16030 [Spirochaetes bacterium]|nr:hypothetical protein [Spirochaetota bacterium]